MSAPRHQQFVAPLVILCVLAFIFLFYRLGAMALIGPDEPRYAQVAREMLDRRDLITPTIGGQPWFEKPVLLYWFMAASFSAFGVTEWAARLPSAVSAFVLLVLVYLAGCRASSPRFGFLSGLVLLVNPMLFSFARGATTDMLLSASLSGGLAVFFLATIEPKPSRRRWLIIAACTCFGLALLAKGLIGVVIPALILGSYFAVHPSSRRGAFPTLAIGLAVTLFVGSVWYVPVIARHGWRFVEEFFLSHHLERFLTNKFRHPGPLSYYLPVILAGSFPWTPLLILSLTRCSVRGIVRRASSFLFTRSRSPRTQPTRESVVVREDDSAQIPAAADPSLTGQALGMTAEEKDHTRTVRVYSLLWLLIPVVFFSFSGSKLPGYILPVMPAIAFLVALELEAVLRKGMLDRGMVIALGSIPLLLLVVLVALCVYSRQVFGLTPSDLAPILIPGATTAIVLALLALKKQVRPFIAVLTVGLAITAVMVLILFPPRLEERESLRPLALIARQQLRPGERIIGYFTWHHSLTFYTNARSLYDDKGNVVIADSPESLQRFISSVNVRLVLTSARAWRDLRRDPRFFCQVLAIFQDRVLLRCETSGP